MTNILLAGATGLVGGHVLAALLADSRVTRLVAPTRRPLAPHPKLLNPIWDSSDLQPGAPWWEVDAGISALGTTRAKAGTAAAFRAIDHDTTLAVAAHLRRGGATRFALTSSMGADARSRFLYTRTKGELEEGIGRLEFPSFTIVRPGFIDGARAEARPLERAVGAVLRAAAPILPAVARVSPASIIAHVLVEAALDGPAGRHVVTSADIARAAVTRPR